MEQPQSRRQRAGERILESGYELLTHRRYRDVGINELIAHAGVTKATFYHHYASKDELMLAVLALREQRATIDWIAAECASRATEPEGRLLAIFDLFVEWFGEPDFDGCPFINTLLELGPGHPAGAAAVRHLANVRALLEGYARDAGLCDVESFARAFHILMEGSIVAAGEGQPSAATTAKLMAAHLIERHRAPAASLAE